MASRTDESAELNRQLDVADADIVLVNKRLDEAQGMFQRHMIRGLWCLCLIRYVLNVDGAAAVEALRVELALAKEQARRSDAAVLKAAKELKAEQAAHRQSKDKIANMALELQNATSRYELLERENQAKTADLKKALQAAKETRSEIQAAREELRQAGDIAAGKPFYCKRNSAI